MVHSLRDTDFESTSPSTFQYTRRFMLIVDFHIDVEHGFEHLEGHLRYVVQYSPKLYLWDISGFDKIFVDSSFSSLLWGEANQ